MLHCSKSPFLNIGVILASLRKSGNIPVSKERLISFWIGIYTDFLVKMFQKPGKNAIKRYRFTYV